MLEICLGFCKSEPQYAYKRSAYKKKYLIRKFDHCGKGTKLRSSHTVQSKCTREVDLVPDFSFYSPWVCLDTTLFLRELAYYFLVWKMISMKNYFDEMRKV